MTGKAETETKKVVREVLDELEKIKNLIKPYTNLEYMRHLGDFYIRFFDVCCLCTHLKKRIEYIEEVLKKQVG